MSLKKQLVRKIMLLILFFAVASANAGSEYLLNPLNSAEALIMPVYIRQYGGFSHYVFDDSQIKSGTGSTLKCSYGTYFRLSGKGKHPTGMISLNTRLDCSGYDQLVLYIRMLSGRLSIKMEADTDKGKREVTSKNIRGLYGMEEVTVDLKGATSLKQILIKLTGESSKVNMKLAFIGLRNSTRYEDVGKMIKLRIENLRLERFLQPPAYKPSGKLSYNLFLTSSESEEYRKYMLENPAIKKKLLAEAKYLKKLPAPELLYDECTTFHGEWHRKSTYERYKKHNVGKYPLLYIRTKGRRAALVGFLLKDKALLRLAMRYCLTIALADSWADNGFMDKLPDFGAGGSMAFTESDTTRDVAFMLDFAGEMLNLRGRQLIRSRIARNGLGQLNHVAWTKGGHQHSNQMCHFSMGRVAAYLILEKDSRSMENMKAYTDLAIKDLDRTVRLYFKPDGGCTESTFYVAHTIGWMMEPYLMYATARGRELSQVVPVEVEKSGRFAQIVLSSRANPECCTIPVGQCSSCHIRNLEIVSAAAIVPDSAWTNIFYKYMGLDKLSNYRYNDPMVWKLGKIIKESKPAKIEQFTFLESCQLVQSTRYFKDQTVKIVFESIASGLGKRQNEVGNFVLEFAGDAFAMDIPSFHNGFYGYAEWHNMLVPMKGNKLLNSIKPKKLYGKRGIDFKKMRIKASGDDRKFSARADLTQSWDPGAFKRWTRKIDSPAPDEITVTDEYELGNNADGVSFCWQTYLPVKKNGKFVEISGRNGAMAQITVPENSTVVIDKINLSSRLLRGLGLKSTDRCSRIRFVRKDKAGKITVKIKLALQNK